MPSRVTFQNVFRSWTPIPSSIITSYSFKGFWTLIPSSFTFTSSSKTSRGGAGHLADLCNIISRGGGALNGSHASSYAISGNDTYARQTLINVYSLTSNSPSVRSNYNFKGFWTQIPSSFTFTSASKTSRGGAGHLGDLCNIISQGGSGLSGRHEFVTQVIRQNSGVVNTAQTSTIVGQAVVGAISTRLALPSASIIGQAVITATPVLVHRTTSTIIGQAVVSATPSSEHKTTAAIVGAAAVTVSAINQHWCTSSIVETTSVTTSTVRVRYTSSTIDAQAKCDANIGVRATIVGSADIIMGPTIRVIYATVLPHTPRFSDGIVCEAQVYVSNNKTVRVTPERIIGQTIVTAHQVVDQVRTVDPIICAAGVTVPIYAMVRTLYTPQIITGQALVGANLNPILTRISPASALIGSPDLIVWAFGQNFDPGAVVGWVQSPPVFLETTFIDNNTLRFVIPADKLAQEGSATIYVYNPSGLVSNGKKFSVAPPGSGNGIIRLGDFSTGHGDFPPKEVLEASDNVFVDGKGTVRVGDKWEVHCDALSCHPSVSSEGSATVFVNGKPVVRTGDALSCGDHAGAGSPDVDAG